MKQSQTCPKCRSKSILSEVMLSMKNYPNPIEIRIPKNRKISLLQAMKERILKHGFAPTVDLWNYMLLNSRLTDNQ